MARKRVRHSQISLLVYAVVEVAFAFALLMYSSSFYSVGSFGLSTTGFPLTYLITTGIASYTNGANLAIDIGIWFAVSVVIVSLYMMWKRSMDRMARNVAFALFWTMLVAVLLAPFVAATLSGGL